MPRLRLIVPCTKRKALPTEGLAMHQLTPSVDADTMAEDWWSRVVAVSRQQTLPAGGLYRGAQWPIVASARQPGKAHLHIMSAGLGLLAEDDRVPGYDATFSNGSMDTVSLPGMTPGQAHSRWWELLSHRRLPGQEGPRTLSALMDANPDDHYLIVASPPYVRAIATDLLRGLSRLASPNRQVLIVTSGPSRLLPSALVLRSQERMRHAIGGGLITLNVRVAAVVASYFEQLGHLGMAKQATERALYGPEQTDRGDDMGRKDKAIDVVLSPRKGLSSPLTGRSPSADRL